MHQLDPFELGMVIKAIGIDLTKSIFSLDSIDKVQV